MVIWGFPGSSSGKESTRRPRFNSWIRKIPWRRDRLPVPVFLGFSGDSDGKQSACNVGDLGLIPGLGRSPGGGHGNPLQYSCLENPQGQRSLAGSCLWGCRVGYDWATKHSTVVIWGQTFCIVWFWHVSGHLWDSVGFFIKWKDIIKWATLFSAQILFSSFSFRLA